LGSRHALNYHNGYTKEPEGPELDGGRISPNRYRNGVARRANTPAKGGERPVAAMVLTWPPRVPSLFLAIDKITELFAVFYDPTTTDDGEAMKIATQAAQAAADAMAQVIQEATDTKTGNAGVFFNRSHQTFKNAATNNPA
jgi:hypothetical protein